MLPVKLLVLALGAVMGLPGCGGDEGPAAPRLDVFAAASLAEAFEGLAEDFEAAHPGARVVLHLAGTPTLVHQLREGVGKASPPADVVATADEASMQELLHAGLVGHPVVFARNRLVIAVPAGNPAGLEAVADLARPGLRVALAHPAVPAGRYTAEILARAGVEVRDPSREPSVRAVLTRVDLGEADAGVVYVTDVRAARGGVEAVEIPSHDNVVARYPIAVVAGADPTGAAEAFVALVRSGPGRDRLAGAGFLPPGGESPG